MTLETVEAETGLLAAFKGRGEAVEIGEEDAGLAGRGGEVSLTGLAGLIGAEISADLRLGGLGGGMGVFVGLLISLFVTFV